ncbi:hypothetical protein LBMAG53_25540 [Planctomycetota bacterium]|nr:hypothetical protein LBMAG53_25540 [Planctomycetota bacterium]
MFADPAASTFDVIVIGAGAGGICAAVAAARSGARTLLAERGSSVGGTGVHAPVGLVCQFYARDGRPVNTGIHRELFTEAYDSWHGTFADTDPVPVYDEAVLAARYRRLVAAEPQLTVWTDARMTAVERDGRRIIAVAFADGRRASSAWWVDGTADGELGALAGARFAKGRPSDGRMMTATLTFRVSGIRLDLLRRPDIRTWGGIRSLRKELTPLFAELKAAGGTTNLRRSVLCFPTVDGQGALFNSTAVARVDPTVPGSVEVGRAEAERQVHELLSAVRRHPAMAGVALDSIAPWLGVREGRRIIGDHVLTGDECLGEARFADMVAACAYSVDIHDPDGSDGRMTEIPGSGYYHIPWRSLIAADLDNLLLGSRCMSGDFIAHSSYRVISGVTAIGQAAGTAAALASTGGLPDARVLPAAAIQSALHTAGQFVEA